MTARHSCVSSHLVNPRTAGYSITPWETSCAIWNPSSIKMHATMSYYIKRQKVRWISTTFKTSEKSTALDVISLVACNLLHEMRNHYFIFLVACNLLHEIRNRWCEEWRSELHWVNPWTAWVFDKSVSNIMCGVESVVHQDAQYKKLPISIFYRSALF